VRSHFTKKISLSFMKYRTGLILASQASLIVLSYTASFLLRFDWPLDLVYWRVYKDTLPVMLLVKIVIFYWIGLCRGWWRYVGVSDLVDIGKAGLASAAVTYIAIVLLFPKMGYPRSITLIDLVMTIVLIGGARFLVRIYAENTRTEFTAKTTLIVGAGEAGSRIVSELRRNPGLDLAPVGFLDDDVSKRNLRIHGVRVLGTTRDLPRIIEQKKVDCVLIAIPSAKKTALQAITDRCREYPVELKILPGVCERINGNSSVTKQVRSLRLEDLLGREPVVLDVDSLRKRFKDEIVLITGGGGSIGSELARQLARFNPRELVLFERSENDLHKIAIELSSRFPELHHVPIVGDILDVGLLRQVVAEHRPHSIFHAAAYKHVPMMETNCFQAVTNNIFGTYNVALVAQQYAVGDFLMISSDKAVNPTSIMGVTKRIAELVVLGLQNHQRTRFVSVRFGNVLGSSGSVVPLFEQQIAIGGPLTVTHPEAKRYFMTIPEAVQLVLQASTMGRGGEIFLLDMGEPVSIVELAKNVIRLSGLSLIVTSRSPIPA
jgi:FlaA1/EpsC-like NDP-sugar epimerase